MFSLREHDHGNVALQGQGDLRITVRASPSSTSPRASHSSSTSHRLGFPDEYAGSSDRAGPSISFGAPADDGISITASGDELGSGEDDSPALPPSGRVALPESDPELTAMLSRAAETIGLHYRRPPSPERSRLDDWFLGAQAERRQPPPVPFFPEVHEEVTRSWKAPFSARNRPSASSVLTTLDGGAAQGYVEVPPVERAIAMQLCPQGAAAWRGNPRLPSRACKFSSALTAKAHGAAGQAASALHAMALLQVHQAKALKQLHEGDADPGVLQELRTATDLALRATKVTARALGQTMSTLVVQERHLWLTLADMRESDKHRFLDSPISQACLFGEAVEDFAQQFSAAQKPTEAFRHILPRRSAAVSNPPPAAAPPSARRRGRPPAASTSAPAWPQQQPALRPQRGAGRRRPAQPASAPAKPVKRQGRRRPWDGRPGAFGSCSSGDGDRTTPCPGGGPGGESFVSFLFCSATDPRVIGTQNFNKRAVSFSSGSQEGEDGSVRDLVSTLPSPSLFASGQQGPVRWCDAFSRIPCRTMEPGQCHTTHSDPTSRRTAFRVGPLCSISLPHRGYVSNSPGPACTVPGGLARAPQAVSLAPETFSEAPGTYGILSRYHAARIASYETASALASRPSPEMGMTPQHIPGLTHPVLPSHLQPLVGPYFSSGRSSPRASIQAHCCFNRRLCHGLGGHVQRARSRGALDRAPAAVAYQLPRVAGSMACSAPLQNAATREACTGPLGQHCDRCVHQPPGRSTLPSHVATRPPSPPLESEASEVASRRSCPRRAQLCSRRSSHVSTPFRENGDSTPRYFSWFGDASRTLM